jgi:hypothetical protein
MALNRIPRDKKDLKKRMVIFMDEAGAISLPLFLIFLSRLLSDNIYLVFSGDPNQLDPISRVSYTLYDLFREMSLEPHFLRENFRQRVTDGPFRKFLRDWWNEERDGSELSELKFGGDERDFERLAHPKIVLCGLRAVVEEKNREEIAKKEGLSMTFDAEIETIKGKEYSAAFIADLANLRLRLELKTGVPVIMLKTVDFKNLYTGSIHEFGGIDEGGRAILTNSQGETFFVEKFREEDILIGKSISTMIQFPFDLFFAVTVHRIQGLTLDRPTLVLLKSMEWGSEKLAYVALSRVTKASHVYSDSDPTLVPKTLPPKASLIAPPPSLVERVLTRGLQRRNDDRTAARIACSRCRDPSKAVKPSTDIPRARITDEASTLIYLCEECAREVCKIREASV